MADTIEQKFGIDVAQALQALAQYDAGLTSLTARLDAVATAMTSFNRRATKSTTGFTKNTDAANQYNNALNQLANQGLQQVQTQASNVNNTFAGFRKNATGSIQAATKAAGEFTVSWETLSRVVQTQFIVRAMSQIRDLIKQSVGEAIEFQKQVALIGTIAPDANFQDIADQVRSISDNFNLPLLETAKGVYQAISNQVGNFGESLRFTEEAAQFAKATNSTLADSVDLLSGAMRSYGLTVEDTGRISGIFFTAIDKGRVTAEALANAFGRVGPAAAEIGISLEEVAAAAATISDKGISTSETLTQMRGIITALTKPTDAMSKKLAEFGFSSSKSAIEALKLDGVLDLLAKNASAEELGALLPNVRGLGGALAVTGKNLSTFAENIRVAQSNGAEYASSKFFTATATDAETLTKALNQVSNAFTLELGQALVKTGAEFVSVEGRVDGLVATVRVLAASVPGLARSIGTLVVGLSALKLAALATANPMALLVTTAAALAVAIPAALQGIADARSANVLKNFNELQKQNEIALQSFRKTENDKVLAAKKADEEVLRGAFKRVAEINKAYLIDLENAKTVNAAMVADTEAGLDKILDARTDFIRGIESAIESSRSQVKDSQGRIFDIQQRSSDRKFEFDTRGLSDASKVFALTQRANDTARNAETTLARAFQSGDNELRQRALSQFQRADALGEQARSIAENAGNRGLEVKAATDLENISKRQIQAEQRINQLQGQRQRALEQERQRQEKISSQLKEQAKIIVENSSAFDKNGNQLGEDQLKKQAVVRQQALSKLTDLSFNTKDFKIADALGLGQLAQSLQNDLSRRPFEISFNIESSLQRLQSEIQRSLSNVDVKLPFLKQLEDTLGRTLRDSPDQINVGLREVAGEAQAIRANIAAQATLDEEIVRKRAEIQTLISTLEQRAPIRDDLGKSFQPAQQAVKDTIASLQTLSSATTIDIGKVNQEIEKLKQVDFGGKFQTLQSDATAIQAAFQQAGQLADKLDQRQNAEPIDLNRLQQIQTLLNQVGLSDGLANVSTAATTIANTVQPIASIENHALNTATYYEQAANALQSIANIQLPNIGGGAQTQTAQFGKMATRYFANGGMARGMDTIPVMARAGESILTPEATSRWFSQIQAMNAGRTPVFRQDGGTVNNTTVGDINITGSGNPEATGRAVMNLIRREQRRGSGRI